MKQPVYKVCPASTWNEAKRAGIYQGSADDRRDGYIHLSTAAQLPGTLAKHFAGQTDLVLVSLAEEQLGSAIIWEPSRGGQLFPHLYSDLDPNLALSVKPITLADDGSHRIPEDIV